MTLRFSQLWFIIWVYVTEIIYEIWRMKWKLQQTTLSYVLINVSSQKVIIHFSYVFISLWQHSMVYGEKKRIIKNVVWYITVYTNM